MKQIVFIVGILLAALLLSPSKRTISEHIAMTGHETTLCEKTTDSDMKERLEKISKDLRGSNFLTPRRPVQSTYNQPSARILKTATRLLYDVRLRGADQLQRISEYNSLCQTINYSALLTRTGYHVLALRKLLI